MGIHIFATFTGTVTPRNEQHVLPTFDFQPVHKDNLPYPKGPLTQLCPDILGWKPTSRCKKWQTSNYRTSGAVTGTSMQRWLCPLTSATCSRGLTQHCDWSIYSPAMKCSCHTLHILDIPIENFCVICTVKNISTQVSQSFFSLYLQYLYIILSIISQLCILSALL